MPENVPDLTPPAPSAVLSNTYTSIPTDVEAIQWTGENIHQLWDWITAEFLCGPIGDNEMDGRSYPAKLYVAANDAWLDLEVGEWIIQDKLGFYPCKDSVFRAKYRRKATPINLSGAPRVVFQGGDISG